MGVADAVIECLGALYGFETSGVVFGGSVLRLKIPMVAIISLSDGAYLYIVHVHYLIQYIGHYIMMLGG